MAATVTSTPNVMHGTPCFAGTRVPVTTLFDYLGGGYNTEYFLLQFPSVKREQVQHVLESAAKLAADSAERLPPKVD